MVKISSIAGAAASGVSAGVVVPVVMLIGVLGAVTGVVLGIGRWKERRGYIRRLNSPITAKGNDSKGNDHVAGPKQSGSSSSAALCVTD